MARIKRENPTRLAIIQVAIELFFEKGFSNTTAAAVCRGADIGTGNLTFYFPTKEHILDVLVTMMCDFQWKLIEDATDEGKSSLLSYCLEVATMVAISEENTQMHDFYVSAYSHPITLENIRANDVEKMRQVFGQFCPGWTEEQFVEAEAIVSGIEYATLMTTKHSASLPVRVEGALDAIMKVFNVPEEIRKMKVQKVLAMDYRAIGRRVLEDFYSYVSKANEKAITDLLQTYHIKKD
ncbi:MAG: TetR/AcrR family transcriptional regulator [Clostridia bacterium]|nr:TetR/AcrR family transcriptional regulator [Clostridia bacterium]